MTILDTNILIYLSKKIINIDEIVRDDEVYAISIISYMEVLGFNFKNKEEEKFIKKFLSFFEIIDIDKEVANLVIEIKRKRKIKLPDAIICATALYYNCDLITNDKDLKNIYKYFKEQK